MECWKTVAIHSRQRAMSPTRGAGLAAEPHLAGVGLEQAGQDRDEGRLPGAVAADQAEALARR